MQKILPPVFIILITFLFACSSNKDTFLNRMYQDTTSRYNAYFNADLRMEQAMSNIEESHTDDFSNVLDLYPERNVELAGTYSAEFDEIIKKSSKAVQLKEISKWTDDHYLLIGQSYFLKGEFNTALETFQYIITNYKDENKPTASSGRSGSSGQSRGRSSRRPASRAQLEQQETEQIQEESEEMGQESFMDKLRHHAAKWDALVWALNSYTELNKYQEANSVLTLINSKPYFPERNLEELYRAEAHLRIRTEDYEAAIPAMEKYIEEINRNRNKIRPTYILAQLYERTGQPAQALEHYRTVLDNRPNYELEFNANMSIARIASSDGIMSPQEVERLLTRMLRDQNNQEFFDQIYYAMAELELSRGNQRKALEYLKESIEASRGNANQLGLSYMRIGEIHYKNENYFDAQPGYQNAASNLPNDHEKYREVEHLSKVLTDLTTQLNIIEENDSLMHLANLPEDQRMRILRDKASAELAEKDRQRREGEQEASAADFMSEGGQQRETDRSQTSGGGWYFYNNAAVSSGFNEFVGRWGNRKREDDWRRSDRSSSDDFDDMMSFDIDAELDLDDIDDSDLDEYDRLISKYLSGLPIEPEQLEIVSNELIQAYYTKGFIYRNELENPARAVESFEKLMDQFPQSDYRAEVAYILYLLHQNLGNNRQKEKYKSIVLNEFPESMFARSIKQPGGIDDSKQNIEIAEQLYSNAYYAYNRNDFAFVFNAKPKADSLLGGHPLQAKFALLTALSIGHTDSLSEFKTALENLKVNFPGTEEYEMADRILDAVFAHERAAAGAEPELGGLTPAEMELAGILSKYKLNLADEHHIIIVNADKSAPSRVVINPLAQFNDKEYSLISLQITPLVIGTPETMVLVKSFPNSQNAMNYYNKLVSKRSEIFPELDTDKLSFYVISNENLQKVIQERELENYIEFFQATYLK